MGEPIFSVGSESEGFADHMWTAADLDPPLLRLRLIAAMRRAFKADHEV
jgi:hypothetical protein